MLYEVTQALGGCVLIDGDLARARLQASSLQADTRAELAGVDSTDVVASQADLHRCGVMAVSVVAHKEVERCQRGDVVGADEAEAAARVASNKKSARLWGVFGAVPDMDFMRGYEERDEGACSGVRRKRAFAILAFKPPLNQVAADGSGADVYSESLVYVLTQGFFSPDRAGFSGKVVQCFDFARWA